MSAIWWFLIAFVVAWGMVFVADWLYTGDKDDDKYDPPGPHQNLGSNRVANEGDELDKSLQISAL